MKLSWSLLPNWAQVLKSSWAVRLAFVSAVLSALEFALPYIAPAAGSGWFALLAMLVSLGAAVARVVAQPEMMKKIWGNRLEEEEDDNAK